MFGRTDKTTTERTQLIDETTEDEVIETKIKECQRENGRCMVSTSRRLRIFYGDEKVNRVLHRLNRRKQRGNKYQEKGINEIINLVKGLAKTRDSFTAQSRFEL
ncbi:MAG: hypothetical protein H8D35_08035 [Nitrosopumilus sp.]|nr:hypothetical protein [Nitrosopumilus sp.]